METEGAGLVLEGRVIWLAEEAEGRAGGGGRPGVHLIGGGRRGRGFTLDGRGGSGGSEEFGFAVLVVSGLVWIAGPFLRAGAGAGDGAGGFRPGAGPEGLGAVAGAAAVGLGGTGFGSAGFGEAPDGLGARLGALALRGEDSAAGLVGMPGRQLPAFTLWFAGSGLSSPPACVSVSAPPLTSIEGLGGRVGVVRPAVELLSWGGAPTLALGATAGLGGGLGLAREAVSLAEGVSLGGGGLGAGTGAEAGVSVANCGLGVIEGLSALLLGWSTTAGADAAVSAAG